jgi:hypothetical protein
MDGAGNVRQEQTGKTMSGYDVVIVNYNGEKIIKRCLRSIYASEKKPNKVIVYDNASKDNSKEVIKSQFPKVILIEGKENIGFGRANNAAMRYSDSKYILFSNNDLILEKNCSKILLDGFSDPRIAIINPIIYKGWKKSKTQPIYAFGSTTDINGFNYGLYDNWPDKSNLNCFSGACFMARAEVIKKLKFEKSFFLYYEEAELSARILKQNLKIARLIGARSYHLESHSSPEAFTDGVAFRQFYGVQNRWFMLGKHWPCRLMFAALLANKIHLLYLIYFFAINTKLNYTKLLYIAPISFVRGWRARDRKKPIDAIWYSKLVPVSLLNYFKLGKKVFSKS